MTITEQLLKTQKFSGKSAAIERAKTGLCSLALGREFGESMESFLKRDANAAKAYAEYKAFIGEA